MTASPGLDRGAGDQRVERDDAEAGTRQVETATISPSWASSPPTISIPASSAPRAQSDADRAGDLRVGALDGEVVDHRERLGSDADDVVDVHRHAVDPDGVPAAELLGDASAWCRRRRS